MAVERLQSPIERTPEGHWLWGGPMTHDNLPVIYLAHNRRYSVRRLIFEITRHPITGRERVTTTCGLSRCVRPAHLLSTTMSTNQATLSTPSEHE